MNTAAITQPSGLLRGPAYDFSFIVGIALLGMLTGAFVTAQPEFFWPIVTLDLWLLGYHHVISTYTRLAMDAESFAEHKYKILILPLFVAAGVTGLALGAGIWVLATVYLYWQWFHYTRQSEGVSKAYGGRSKDKDLGDLRVTRVAFYAVPFAGILHVSARGPESFLNMPLWTLPVPTPVLYIVDAIAIVAFLAWLGFQIRAYRRGQLAVPYFAYLMSHFSIFTFAYVVLTNINYGWLSVNIWHNAQYILFVWLFNTRRFGQGIDPKAKFLSTICQSNRFLLYIAFCLTLSTLVYFLIEQYGVGVLQATIGTTTVVTAMIIYQTINFHHYIVDSLIWKLRKKKISSKLGIS